MKKLYPITITSKLEDCKSFYQDVFDFETVFESDWYIQILHKASGIEMAFMQPDLENQPSLLHAQYSGNGIVYSFEVEDAASKYEEVKMKTDSIFYKLTKEEWGQTHFMLKDPAGIVIDVVQQASE